MTLPVSLKKILDNRLFSGLLIGATVLFGVGLLLMVLGLSPGDVGKALFTGSFASWRKFSYVLSIWIPLLLASSGLLFTFRAGLWNIGVEGQLIMGAIVTTFILRLASGIPTGIIIPLALIFGCLGGALWGVLTGILKTRGGVNEIFGGLGFNFVAQGLILWLILGPWKRAGIASMSGTDLLPRALWLSPPRGWQVVPEAIIIATSLFLLCWFLLNKTRFGLRLSGCGSNPRAAHRYGIHADLAGVGSMVICGSLAGLAGGLQVLCVYHRLIPSISSGYGYLALLVVMLAHYRVLPVPFIALLFAGLAAGSIQLPIVLQIDSSLSGVIQGGFVVAALLIHGIRTQNRGKN